MRETLPAALSEQQLLNINPMPKLTFNDPILTVEIPDLVNDTTVVKRKAEFDYLLYQPKDSIVNIGIKIIPFSNMADGSYGNRLDVAGSNYVVQNMEIKSVIDNLVDCMTGEKICKESEEWIIDNSDPENTLPVLNTLLLGKTYARQFDYWHHVASTTPVVLVEAIRQNILSQFTT